MDNHYDLLIIGGGPSGLTAAIYGGRAKLKTVVINKGSVGGLVNNTREIANWPGIVNISGPDLMATFEKHAKAFGVDFLKDTAVEVDFSKEEKFVRTRKKKDLYAKAVIIACGSEPRFLNIPGEKKFMGNGVAYCATCDAESFEGEDVIVVGSGDQAIEEGMYITKFANKVKVIVLHDEGILDCNKISAEKALCHEGMEFIWNSTIQEIMGHENVECVKVKNLKTGTCSDLPCQGVFMFVGMVPSTRFLDGSGVEMDKRGYIPVNEHMETNIPGVYAVGDNRIKYLRQIVTSAGDGATAAVAAERYISELNDFRTSVMGSEGKVLLLFFDAKDNSSLEFGTLLEAVNNEQSGAYKIVKIDVATKTNLAEKYGVKEVPAVLILDRGLCVKQLECTMDKEDLVGQLISCKTVVNCHPTDS
ncbi:FAD-dependent oxidoreductase [Desulfomonile tiedjei]|uniref:Thioredoxin reductase n=1 Tax=Desulfomonile tiedjei (strain ATCC 49306 / DSM 6799 / DCB-1) TaxID=706587 RepID=I4CDV3_DESTA|nr:FAD-dependent oxidoreductase [Desulfomonile tiedjei]AFM27744.1 thioredoxin reductase [Desulfomonile tiedjei DSM 6799]